MFRADPAEHGAETRRGAAASRAPGRARAHPHSVRHAMEHVSPFAAAQLAAPPAQASDQRRGHPGEGGQVACASRSGAVLAERGMLVWGGLGQNPLAPGKG